MPSDDKKDTVETTIRQLGIDARTETWRHAAAALNDAEIGGVSPDRITEIQTSTTVGN
jgi:hypothetical protein